MDFFANHVMNQLTSCLEMESFGSSCYSDSLNNSNHSSQGDEIHQLEDALNMGSSLETDPGYRNYDVRILFETTKEQLTRMTHEEIRSIFQMFCKELTSNDYICIKVGTKKNTQLTTHNLVAASSVAPTEMSGALWATMPEPLVDLILAHLPIPRLFAMRTVCKRWNGLIHSPGFVKTHSQVSSELPYFVLYGMEDHRVQIGPALFTFAYFARDASMYCSTTKKWRTLSFSFLPFSNFYLILTSRGLLCFAIYNLEDEVTLGVCNPITKTWRALPPWLPLRGKGLPDFVAMVVDEVHNSYKIIVIEELDLITRVYESTTKKWQEMERIHASEGLPYLMNRPCEAFVKNGFMYCLSQNLSQIAAYNLEAGIWSRIHLNVPSAHEFLSMRTLGLVESHGRVLVLTRSVVGGDAFALEHFSTDQGCFQVWAVNDQFGLDMVVLGEVPYQPFDSSHDFDSFNIYSFSAEDYKDALIFSSPEWENTWVFDLSDGTWHVVPECPRSIFGPDGVEGFPMELRLDITP